MPRSVPAVAPSPPPALLDQIRPSVRACDVYRVGHYEGITVKLNQNENPFDVPPVLKATLTEAFLSIPWNRYPTEFADDFRAELGAHIGHPPEGIILGNGSNELTYLLGMALVKPGTPVVLPTPMFSLYRKVVDLFEGDPIEVPASPETFVLAQADLLAAIKRAQPGLVVLNTPNNPTGQELAFETLQQIVAVAPGFVLIDEAYYEFIEGPTALALLKAHPQVLIMRTFSKAVGLAGLRLGYLLGHPAVITELSKARLPFMVNRLTVCAAQAVLRRPALVAERVAVIKQQRDALYAALTALPGIRVMPSSANFVIFQTALPAALLVDEMAARGVLIRSMAGYPALAGFVRVNAGTTAENQAFLNALKGVLADTLP